MVPVWGPWYPHPLASHDSRSVLAVKGPQAASRPGLLRADPKGWLFMREKGGKSFFCYLPLAAVPLRFALSRLLSVLYL